WVFAFACGRTHRPDHSRRLYPGPRSAPPRLSGMSLTMLGSLRPLGAVLGPALLAVLHALGIEHAAQDVIAHARKVLHAATTDHDDRVLLQIMALTRNVTDHLETVGEPHLGDLTERRVGLLRRRRIHARADATLLRALLQRRHLLARL